MWQLFLMDSFAFVRHRRRRSGWIWWPHFPPGIFFDASRFETFEIKRLTTINRESMMHWCTQTCQFFWKMKWNFFLLFLLLWYVVVCYSYCCCCLNPLYVVMTSAVSQVDLYFGRGSGRCSQCSPVHTRIHENPIFLRQVIYSITPEYHLGITTRVLPPEFVLFFSNEKSHIREGRIFFVTSTSDSRLSGLPSMRRHDSL